MKKQKLLRSLKFAFPKTLPIFAGFWFLGLSYGIYMNVSGFSFVYPMLMSLTIFGGSLELVAVAMLLSPFALVQTFIMTLMIQARHLFYGISMLENTRTQAGKSFTSSSECVTRASLSITQPKFPSISTRAGFCSLLHCSIICTGSQA